MSARTSHRDGGGAYLLLDGSRPMEGDISMGAVGWGTNAINFGADMKLFATSATLLRLMNEAETQYRSLYMGSLGITNLFSLSVNLVIRGLGGGVNRITWQEHDGVNWLDCAVLDAGSGTPQFRIPRAGDISMLANKLIDCRTNGGELHPARASQSAQPTPSTHELQVWRDPDDNKTYLIYEDTDEGTRKVELT